LCLPALPPFCGRGAGSTLECAAERRNPARLEELFGDTATEIKATRREFTFRYRSAEHFVDVFKTYYGPVKKTFAALAGEPERLGELSRDLFTLLRSFNRSGGRTIAVPGSYLEVVITNS
jgi:hypothetical protein